MSALSEIVSKKAKDLQMDAKLKGKETGTLQWLSDSVTSFASLAPQIPFFVSTAVQGYIFEREKQMKKVGGKN